MLGLRSLTMEFIKLLSLPVLLDSPSNLTRQSLSFVSRGGNRGSGSFPGPQSYRVIKLCLGPRPPDSQPRVFALGTGCILTLTAMEIQAWEIGEAGISSHAVLHTPSAGCGTNSSGSSELWNLRRRRSWNRGLLGILDTPNL